MNGPIEGRVRLTRPYFRIALVAIAAAALIGAGYFGPHPAPQPAPSASPTNLADGSALASSGSPGPTTDPLAGLTKVDLHPGQVEETPLPGQISSQSMAVVGTTLYFIVDGNRILSTAVGGNGSRRALAQVPACQGISQLAAAGHELAYVVTSPGGPTSEVAECSGAGLVSWSVWLLDLDGGIPVQVAQGVRPPSTMDVSEFPIHLALTESGYAFDRPPTSAGAAPGETIEVHALDGTLLWTSRTTESVADVMLGGGTLAILTNAIPLVAGADNLYTSTAAHPDPAPVDQPASSAYLSRDGLHLTWDVAYQGPWPNPNPAVGVAIETVASGVENPVVTLTDLSEAAPLRPTVSSTAGRLLVTWFATGPDGAVYPALRYATGGDGAFLPSLQEPIWMDVQGGKLFWVAESADGWSKVAFAIDLASLGLR